MLIPPHFYFVTKENPTEITTAACPTRTLVFISVLHCEMVNDLVPTIRPKLEWSSKNHISLLFPCNLKPMLFRPFLQDDLRTSVEPPKNRDENNNAKRTDDNRQNNI